MYILIEGHLSQDKSVLRVYVAVAINGYCILLHGLVMKASFILHLKCNLYLTRQVS
jgi:hypothetical protein